VGQNREEIRLAEGDMEHENAEVDSREPHAVVEDALFRCVDGAESE
jgi:hypothetical protein